MKFGTENNSRRNNWIINVLKDLPEGQSILDAGAGELPYKNYCSHLSYISQDFGKYDGKGDSHGMQTGTWDNSKLDIISDIASIPVSDNKFDNILCTEVLEHVPEPIKVLNEFYRILKPNGKLILTAPFNSITHFAPYHFHTGFNRYFYERFLNEIGFDIIELSYNGNFFEYIAQDLQILNSVAKEYTKVKLSLIERLARYILVRKLSYLSEKDTNSNLLLSFGIHIVAKKNK